MPCRGISPVGFVATSVSGAGRQPGSSSLVILTLPPHPPFFFLHPTPHSTPSERRLQPSNLRTSVNVNFFEIETRHKLNVNPKKNAHIWHRLIGPIQFQFNFLKKEKKNDATVNVFFSLVNPFDYLNGRVFRPLE